MTLQVFISYKREYLEFATAVKNRIHEWGYGTWFDVDDIEEGTYFRHAIQHGLETSEVMVGVLTEDAIRSREVQAEWDYFLIKEKKFIPLRKQAIEPPYHLLTIQYIDFVTDEKVAFEKLQKRLSELAISLQKDAIASLEKSEEVILDDFLQEKSEQKKEVLEDGLFGAPDLSTADAPKPQPALPQLEQQSPSGSVASLPATAPFQPSRQNQTLPQPPALGRKRSSPILLPLAAVASLIIVVGVVVLLSSGANISIAAQPPQGASPLILATGIVILLIVIAFQLWRNRTQAFSLRSALRMIAILFIGASVLSLIYEFSFTNVAAFLAGIFALLTSPLVSDKPVIQSSEERKVTDEVTNRATMLQNVEDFWLKGVLDPALEAGKFEMGLSSAPGAVLRHKDYGDYELPANANILDVFNDLNRELLILGAPGGGKTVLLLQLTKELIGQAREDANKAIPVVFNLSS